MYCNIHKFRNKLAAGELCLGTGITLNDSAVTEALGDSVDFVWIDMEHNPLGFECIHNHLVAARAAGTPAIVRVPVTDVAWTKRVLDTGAEGIIAPQVADANDVREFVSACRYPPMGTRGYGPRRPSNYGRSGGPDYLERANKDLFVAVQIETRAAAEQLEEIVAIEGLDSLVIGPNDLAGALGVPGQPEHPTVVAVIEEAVARAHEKGLYVGMGMGDDAPHAVASSKMGVDWIQVGSDFSYMYKFADRLFADIREQL